MGQKLVRPLDGVDLVDLGAADRRVEHPDQDLPGIELLGHGDLIDHQGLARLRQDRGAGLLHLHCRLAIRNR